MAVLPDVSAVDLVAVARIAEPYGVKGWVHVVSYADDSALLDRSHWCLSATDDPDGARSQSRAVLHCRPHGKGHVAQLAGVTDRDQALLLRGMHILAARADFPALSGDEYYWVDLEGCAVLNRENLALGVVAEVADYGAHPVLIVHPSSADLGDASAPEVLIPFVAVFVDSVDLSNKIIRVDWQRDY
ncbi:MAG: ribosome maturation factor RimM [Burkholderiaceae bacterium]